MTAVITSIYQFQASCFSLHCYTGRKESHDVCITTSLYQLYRKQHDSKTNTGLFIFCLPCLLFQCSAYLSIHVLYAEYHYIFHFVSWQSTLLSGITLFTRSVWVFSIRSNPTALAMCKNPGQALSLHHLWPPSSNGYQVELKFVLWEWFQLQKYAVYCSRRWSFKGVISNTRGIIDVYTNERTETSGL